MSVVFVQACVRMEFTSLLGYAILADAAFAV